MIRAVTLGWKADAALALSGGRARVLAALSESVYLTAGDAIVWLGHAGATLHPRAILTGAPLPAADAAVEVGRADAGVWRPAALPRAARTRLRASLEALLGALGALGAPDGFGALLVGRAPAFPLDAAAGRAARLAAACDADDADAALEAATDLLGLGPGLTPSGDDFAGAAFFARALLDDAAAARAAWARAGAALVMRARERTHPISAALLADMVEGCGHAPLHELAQALVADAPPAATLEAARRLVRIGHSSGWDVLAGLTAGVAGSRAFPAIA